MRRIAAALVIPLIAAAALAGCGTASSPAISSNAAVAVSGIFGKSPTVQIPAKKASKDLRIRTEVRGTGPALPSGDSILGNFAIYVWSGKTHKLLDSTFTSSPQVLPAQLPLPGLVTALKGQRMGSRLLAVLPPKYGYGSQGDSNIGIAPTDTTVWVIDLIKAFSPTASASGTQVSNGGGSLPAVTATATGTAPTVKIPSSSPPKKLVAKTLIQGSGPTVTKGEEVVTQYVGVNWRTGKEFDSSWSRGSAFGFEIDATPAQIIPGWDKALTGQKVGSRILLVIPPADGYGKTGSSAAGIKGTDTLVFVVDILDAQSAAIS